MERDWIVFTLLLFALPSQATVQMYYLHNDHLGTPRVITNQAQQVVWKGQLKPFGETKVEIETITNHRRFPGQRLDIESRLYYNYFRDYDPSTGRYIQSDPIGLRGGMNTYAYANGNPVRYIDPLGLDVTACLYYGMVPHVGLAVNSSATTGRRTDGTSNPFDILIGKDVPGEVSDDPDNPGQCTTTKTTSDQDRLVQDYIDNNVLNAGNYNLYSRSCVDFVRDAYKHILGIPLSDTVAPGEIFREISSYKNKQ